MTQKQAEKQLERLRKETCTCECEELQILYHKAGCRYRTLAFGDVELRPFAGPLYSVA